MSGRRLVRVGEDRIEYHASSGAYLFCLSFFLVPIALYRVMDFGVALFVLCAIAIVGVVLGLNLLMAPIQFDRQLARFDKGKALPFISPWCIPTSVSIADIQGLQILTKKPRPGRSDWERSAELNLVLTDHRRINVLNVRDSDQIQSDAFTISEFLKVPVWECQELT